MCMKEASYRNAEAPVDILLEVALDSGRDPMGEGSGERPMQNRHFTSQRPAKPWVCASSPRMIREGI